MAADLIVVQMSERGKFHAMDNSRVTACGAEIPTEGVTQRYLSLVDSRDRCRHDKCIAARNRAAGRV